MQSKVTIFIRKYQADTVFYGDRIEERNQRTISEYTESKSLMNVGDPQKFKQDFIEEMGRKVYNQNKREEEEVRRKKKHKITKLIVYKIE